MTEELAATAAPGQSGHAGSADSRFDEIATALDAAGPAAALERLTAELDARGDFRAMLDALLLRARHELGMPLIPSGSLADLAEPVRGQFEERYIEAIRLVGSRYLEAGDIATAWAYLRVIAEPEPVARAIAEFTPTENDDSLGAVIEVAFNHGVSPRRGFALILEHYGTCPAITAFEQLPTNDPAVRASCAEQLIAHVHRELGNNLRAEIAARGQLSPAAGLSIAEMVRGREWLFTDDSYHIDISHLAAVVRFARLVTDRRSLELAVDLTEYGRRLAPRLQLDGHPPFENIFDDHRIYLRAILGDDADEAIAHFRAKLVPDDEGMAPDPTLPAQVLVNLLVAARRLDEAIDVAAEHLAGMPESALTCPTAAQLCLTAGKPERLASLARARGNLVDFTAALLSNMPRA